MPEKPHQRQPVRTGTSRLERVGRDEENDDLVGMTILLGGAPELQETEKRRMVMRGGEGWPWSCRSQWMKGK